MPTWVTVPPLTSLMTMAPVPANTKAKVPISSAASLFILSALFLLSPAVFINLPLPTRQPSGRASGEYAYAFHSRRNSSFAIVALAAKKELAGNDEQAGDDDSADGPVVDSRLDEEVERHGRTHDLNESQNDPCAGPNLLLR